MFTADDVIYAYTRAQAIEDGELIDVSETAREAGFRYPVSMTRAAWGDFVAWSEGDTRRKGCPQDEAGRLWDVLWIAKLVAKRASGNEFQFNVYRVPREGRGRTPKLARLKAMCGPGDDGEPVVTIMMPNED